MDIRRVASALSPILPSQNTLLRLTGLWAPSCCRTCGNIAGLSLTRPRSWKGHPTGFYPYHDRSVIPIRRVYQICPYAGISIRRVYPYAGISIRRVYPSDGYIHPTGISIRRVYPSDGYIQTSGTSIRRGYPPDRLSSSVARGAVNVATVARRVIGRHPARPRLKGRTKTLPLLLCPGHFAWRQTGETTIGT